ncbi:MAG: phenylalanine--tRNA ligase beta subunit-related protein [Firmicutes bacterium]|jgi:DNA/RNA-binding domain of Phe-tRNA-synthetase-like protein|nr:phenylalanine--tRNA ligase beta subunit-related protein [Bacillota bacterium]
MSERYFKVDKQVFQVLPEAVFGVVVATGIDNRTEREEIRTMLDHAVASARERYEGRSVRESTEVRPYRQAFETLGINPNKFQSSIEAMLTRIAKGGTLPHINPIVDLVNAISLTHAVPMGSHDIDTLGADMEVRFSREGDRFTPFGSDEAEAVPAGEIVYVSGGEVRTRRWIWRQSNHGKTTAETTNLFFPVDGFSGEGGNLDRVIAARDALAAAVRDLLGTGVTIHLVDREHPEARIL